MSQKSASNNQRKQNLSEALNLDTFTYSGGDKDKPNTDGHKNKAIQKFPLTARGGFKVPLNIIEEDPNQPRRTSNFNDDSLNDLAESIRTKGQTTPISIRPHPENEGKYMLVNGARRYRATRHILKRTHIEALIEDEATKSQQFADNLQREDFNNDSILHYIEECIQKGMKATEIALDVNKSQAWVSMHKKILNTKNATLREAFITGVIDSATAAYDLVLLSQKEQYAAAVYELLTSHTAKGEISITVVKTLKHSIDNPQTTTVATDAATDENSPATEPLIPYTTAEIKDGNNSVGGEDDNEGNNYEANYTPDEDQGQDASSEFETDKPTPAPRAPKGHIYCTFKEETVELLPKVASGKTKAVIKMADGNEKEVAIIKLQLYQVLDS